MTGKQVDNDGATPFPPLSPGRAPSEIEGATDGADVPLTKEEQHVLQCLGVAVLAEWTELSTEVQKRLFAHAASSGDPRYSTALREQIARFLHNHKDDPHHEV